MVVLRVLAWCDCSYVWLQLYVCLCLVLFYICDDFRRIIHRFQYFHSPVNIGYPLDNTIGVLEFSVVGSENFHLVVRNSFGRLKLPTYPNIMGGKYKLDVFMLRQIV